MSNKCIILFLCCGHIEFACGFLGYSGYSDSVQPKTGGGEGT